MEKESIRYIFWFPRKHIFTEFAKKVSQREYQAFNVILLLPNMFLGSVVLRFSTFSKKILGLYKRMNLLKSYNHEISHPLKIFQHACIIFFNP